MKPANWQHYEYPFIYGQFDQSLFPTNDWRECCLKALSVMEIRNWAPDLIERDDESLIQQIRTRVLPRRGVFAMPDEIVVTNGCQQALYLIADLLCGKHSTVGFENPAIRTRATSSRTATRGCRCRRRPRDRTRRARRDALAATTCT